MAVDTDILTSGGRYCVQKHGLFWHVHAGTGTRSLFSSMSWITATRVANELETAFNDGAWVASHDDADEKP